MDAGGGTADGFTGLISFEYGLAPEAGEAGGGVADDGARKTAGVPVCFRLDGAAGADGPRFTVLASEGK